MNFLRLISLTVCWPVLIACVSSRQTQGGVESSLHKDFFRAYSIDREDFPAEDRTKLGTRLHQKLRSLGDGVFAQALSKQPYEVQIEVVNVMGFLNPSLYDDFPKTKDVLSSAPKI